MSKHTLGPWKYDTFEGNNEDAFTWDVILDPDGNQILHSCRDKYDDIIALNDADWELIAAAPQMLDVLKKLVVMSCQLPNAWTDEEEKLWQLAEAAVRKAKGWEV